MGSDGFPGGAGEDGFGGLKDPLGTVVGLLVDVDLYAFACGREDSVLR